MQRIKIKKLLGRLMVFSVRIESDQMERKTEVQCVEKDENWKPKTMHKKKRDHCQSGTKDQHPNLLTPWHRFKVSKVQIANQVLPFYHGIM